MDALIEIGLFTGKTAVVVLAIALILILFFALLARARGSKALLDVENLNRKYERLSRALKSRVLGGEDSSRATMASTMAMVDAEIRSRHAEMAGSIIVGSIWERQREGMPAASSI